MSDASDLVAVVGELDREIEAAPDPEARRAEAATLIPPLGRADAAGWYDRLLTATRHEPDVHGLDEALRALSISPGRDQFLPRRLAVLGAVARAFPDRYGPEGSEREVVQRALSAPRILREESDEPHEPEPPDQPPGIRPRAPDLHSLLFDRDVLPHIGEYPRLLDEMVARNMAHQALLAIPAPCTSEVVRLTGLGGTEVAVALSTRVCVEGLTLDDLYQTGSFLHPANWGSYDQWCSMTPDPANPPDPYAAARFLEEVALDCPSGWLRVAVWLDFTPLVRRDKALLRDYRMTRTKDLPAAGPAGNGAVTVDEGSLKVAEEDGHLRVSSTKRVNFTFGLDSTVIAVLACVAGYGALAAEWVVDGTGGVARAVGCLPVEPSTLSAPSTPSPFDPLDGPVADVLATVDECVATAQDWTQRVASGAYTAEAMARDVAGSVVRSLRLWTQLSGVAAVVADPPAVQDDVTSEPFHLPPSVSTPGRITLDIAGPLRSLSGLSQLPAGPSRAWCVPDALASASESFRVRVRPVGAPAGNYLGTAIATDAAGMQHQVAVDVQVP